MREGVKSKWRTLGIIKYVRINKVVGLELKVQREKQGDLQDRKLVKKGGHQSETPVEKKDIVVARGSEMRDHRKRRKDENGDENFGKAQKEEQDVKHWGGGTRIGTRDLGKDEGIAGRGTGKVGAEDTPVNMIKEVDARNARGVNKVVELAPLNNRITVGDKQLINCSRV